MMHGQKNIKLSNRQVHLTWTANGEVTRRQTNL